MPKYDISANQLGVRETEPNFGVEIRPPVSDVVAAGLCRALQHMEDAGHLLILDAAVTRNDEQGTALIVKPSYDSDWTPDAMTSLIGRTMDPLNTVEKDFHWFIEGKPYGDI